VVQWRFPDQGEDCGSDDDLDNPHGDWLDSGQVGGGGRRTGVLAL
jgi:hypothetical protein